MMRWTLRARLRVILGVTAGALLFLAVLDGLMASRVEEELDAIERSYLPLVELGPAAEGQFETLRRAFQDAVAAEDDEALEAASGLRDRLLAIVDRTPPIVDRASLAALRQQIVAYYTRARDVATRLIHQPMDEVALEQVDAMQNDQRQLQARIGQTLGLDRRKLGEAFARARSARRGVRQARMAVHIVLFGAVAVLVVGIGRRAVRSLHELTTGFARLGRGEFEAPVRVTGGDELADVAEQANRMATELRALDAGLREKQEALERSNRELEAFCYSVSHDLRAPLRAIDGFSQALLEDAEGRLDEDGKRHLRRVRMAAQRMGHLIDDLLALSRISRGELSRQPVDLGALGREVLTDLLRGESGRDVEAVIAEPLEASGDARLLRIMFENLLGNALKFTSKVEHPRIEIGRDAEGRYFVRDNGAGFDMAYAGKLFAPFQRLHATTDFPGTGIGLATVQRIILRHGGAVHAEGTVGQGAVISFSLGQAASEEAA